jgi:methylthioribose-1-phosphate isomerase
MVQSPLFEPVLWGGHGFRILNELLLPETVEYLEITDVSNALEAVRLMRTRAFGQVLTFIYSAVLVADSYQDENPQPLRQELIEMTRAFCEARPTFDFAALGAEVLGWLAKLPPGEAAGKWVAKNAHLFVRRIMEARRARAQRAAVVLRGSGCVLTHCNVSGELVAVAQYCKALGKDIAFIATETRPYLQGTKLTAWELAQAGVRVSLIPDCAMAQVMAKGQVDEVLVGADRAAQNGDVINKVGTYSLALMARDYGLPFHALVQEPRSLARGQDIPIEERPEDELLTFHGQRLLAGSDHSVMVRYPAFDVTPSHLVTTWISFDGAYSLQSFRQKFQTSPVPCQEKTEARKRYLLVFGIPSKSHYGYLADRLEANGCESILLPEMRPQLWGARVVARGLLERQTPTTLIADSMMGTLFAHGEISRVYLFAHGGGESGRRGICGSLLAIRLALAHGVAVELLDSEVPKETPVDHDVATFLGHRVIPAGATVHPLENEIIPETLVKKFQGIN